MKTNFFLASLFLITFSMSAQINYGIQGKENWFEGWTNFDPKKKEYKETNKTLSGIITENTVLSNRYTYLLHGVVYVTNNAVLTIEPGTVIRGDYKTCGTLVITKGSKIIANGTPGFPIVFTTNQDTYTRRQGDWGGIVLMGEAPVNNYGGIGILKFDFDQKYNVFGGNNLESDSGILNYVRIEYSGRKLSSKKELNGISFAGVGKKTIVKNIQISYSNDDSFEFYGGSLEVENLISYRSTDDDYDFTQGAQITLKNSIAIRNPYSSDFQGSRAMEISVYDEKETHDPTRNLTSVIAENVTLVNLEDNEQGLVKEAIFLDLEARLSMKSCVVFGFEDFMKIKRQLVTEEFEEYVKMKDVNVVHCANNFATVDEPKVYDVENRFDLKKRNVNVLEGEIFDFFVNPEVKQNPDFRYNKVRSDKESVMVKTRRF